MTGTLRHVHAPKQGQIKLQTDITLLKAQHSRIVERYKALAQEREPIRQFWACPITRRDTYRHHLADVG